MDAASIERGKGEIVERYGPWTSHRLHIAHGVYTMEPRGQSGYPLRQVMQSIADVSCGEWSRLRILDLACLEGSFAIEAARHGAHAVGIEGREANLAKA